MLEELWLTQACWFRLYTTFFGIHVTDCWKPCRRHLHKYDPMACQGVVAFTDRLAKVLIYNGLADTASIAPLSGRPPRHVLRDVTSMPSAPLHHSCLI
jgi:hypothetical protein